MKKELLTFTIDEDCDKVQQRVRIKITIVTIHEIPEYEEIGGSVCNYERPNDCPELCLPKKRAIEEAKRRKRTK